MPAPSVTRQRHPQDAAERGCQSARPRNFDARSALLRDRAAVAAFLGLAFLRGVAHIAAGGIDRPDLQRLPVDPEMDLAPDARFAPPCLRVRHCARTNGASTAHSTRASSASSRLVCAVCSSTPAITLVPYDASPAGFVHVWMPPLVQVVFERLERVIGCGHVSGLSLRRLIRPRASMAMRGSEADQQTELVGSSTNTAFSDPDLVDPLPLLFSDLLTLPTRRGGME